jgi:hypothetical protein
MAWGDGPLNITVQEDEFRVAIFAGWASFALVGRKIECPTPARFQRRRDVDRCECERYPKPVNLTDLGLAYGFGAFHDLANELLPSV